MVALIILAVPLLLGLVLLIANYNRFVGVQQHLRESWSDIRVELKRRHDLIPNLVTTVKGYATHEQAVLEEVVRLRNHAAGAFGDAQSRGDNESALNHGVRRMFAVVENYPELKASSHFLALQDELAITEDRLAAARRFYNGNVREMNQLCRAFPTNIIAGMFGFREASYFKLASDAERVVPRVSLRV